MIKNSSLLALLLPHTVLAGCLSLADPPPGSSCSAASTEIEWLNPPGSREISEQHTTSYDPLLADAAFFRGVYAGRDARFRLRAPGRHLIEVFLLTTDHEKHSFVMEVAGKIVDERYRARPTRFSPRRSMRHLWLVGAAEGGQEFTLRSDSPRHILTAVRWTPWEVFESQLAPKLLARVRALLGDPFRGGLRERRRSNIAQMCELLAWSDDPQVKGEAVLGLTRATYWAAAESHQPRDVERTALLFEQGLRLIPQHPILRQMITASCAQTNVLVQFGKMPEGKFCEQAKPVPWEVSLPLAPGAPGWAVEQRKLRARMEAITRWWVEKRQQLNGELGGGWEDDVEIIRHWGPQALGLGSEVAARGIRRLADGLWSSGALANGYDKRITDVEHSSESTTDTQPMLAALDPENPAVLARLAETSNCAQNWIAQQPDGRWRFRGAWFNCREFDPRPERAVDVHLNLRAMGPALWHAYLTRDPRLVPLLGRWAESWTEAMRSSRHGKPAGIFPSAVKSANGDYLIGSDRWDKPNAEWDYFQWAGRPQEALTSLLLAVHDLTGEHRWLKAAGESFTILDRCGAAAHLCEEIRKEPQAFYEWRRRSGDPRYDRFFGYVPSNDAEGTLKQMEIQAREAESKLAVNFEMLTSEVMYTDRVYYPVPVEYRLRLFGGEAPRGERYPTFSVTWPPAHAEFARAVLDAGDASLKLCLYNFEAQAADAAMRLWRLKPGRYEWRSADMAGAAVAAGTFELARRAQTVRLPMPPRRAVTIDIWRAQ